MKTLLIHRCDTNSAFFNHSVPSDIFDPKVVFGIRSTTLCGAVAQELILDPTIVDASAKIPLQISRQILMEQSALRDVSFNVRFGDIIQYVLRAVTSNQASETRKEHQEELRFHARNYSSPLLLRAALVASHPETRLTARH